MQDGPIFSQNWKSSFSECRIIIQTQEIAMAVKLLSDNNCGDKQLLSMHECSTAKKKAEEKKENFRCFRGAPLGQAWLPDGDDSQTSPGHKLVEYFLF